MSSSPQPVVVIGGGPAGLAAAEVLSAAGRAVHLYDAMPSVGRKFLLAGRGGLNLTHGEGYARFLTRFHYKRVPLDDAMSGRMLDRFIESLDGDKMMFLASDIAEFDQYRAALATLPQEQRDVYLLHEESGLSLEEIARITGVGPETAKSRLRYAVGKLKAALAAAQDVT